MRIGLAGATGLVGREFLALLARRGFPPGELRLFASERSAGTTLNLGAVALPVADLATADLREIDVWFASIGKAAARQHAPRLAAAGAVVIDNSSAFRSEAEVPLIVPEVNGAALSAASVTRAALAARQGRSAQGAIIANPNCTTILLATAIAPLERAFGLEEVVVSTYQAVSGAGRAARDELFDQARAFARGEQERHAHYDRPIFLNLLPKIGAWHGGDCFEEIKVARETRRLLGRTELPIHVTTVRVPVERCHSLSVYLRLRWPVTAGEVEAALAGAAGVELADLPTPRELARREAVFAGRVRVAPEDRRVVQLWVVGDQLWKGAALNVLQIADLLAREGWFESAAIA